MNIKMKEMPISERPYEKLKMYGAETLTNSELLAIIIKNGTKECTALDLAKEVLKLNDNNEKEDLSFNEAISIVGIPSLEICDYFDMMQNPSGLYNVNTYSIGTNNGIAITQSYDGNLSQIYFDTLEDSYQMKELKIYSSTYSYNSGTNKSVETKYAINIKTKLFGLITKPSNLNKY